MQGLLYLHFISIFTTELDYLQHIEYVIYHTPTHAWIKLKVLLI